MLVPVAIVILACPPQPTSSLTPASLRFHNHFWVNLHHHLYFEANPRRRAPPDQRPAAWNAALDHYATHYVRRDLLRDADMRLLDLELGQVHAAEDLADQLTDRGLAPVLRQAAPIYRERWWSAHHRANEEWQEAVQPLCEKHLSTLSAEVAEALAGTWPGKPIRVDVLCYASWAGAYTSFGPSHIRIGASTPGAASPADAFETLLHEATHLLYGPAGGELNDHLQRAAREAGYTLPDDLWHAILFYTVGEIVRRSPASPDDYVPYAQRQGLFGRGPWVRFHEVLQDYWQPYLDGESDLEMASAEMVESLATIED